VWNLNCGQNVLARIADETGGPLSFKTNPKQIETIWDGQSWLEFEARLSKKGGTAIRRQRY
jgi:hypothetical protein